MNPLASGNKTIAAGGLSGVVALVIAIGMLWDLPAHFWWWDKAVQTFSLLVGFLGASGVLHKVWKWFHEPKSEGADGDIEEKKIS